VSEMAHPRVTNSEVKSSYTSCHPPGARVMTLASAAVGAGKGEP
jgi:hypothetical protein